MARDVSYDIVSHDKSDRGLRSAERGLDRLKKKADETSGIGDKIGKTLTRTFGSSISSLPSQLASGVSSAGYAGVAAMAAVAPLIGATLVSGILLALGGGVIVAGIIGAMQDPGVKSAASELGSTIKSTFTKATAGFAGPLKQSFGLIQTAIQGNADEIKKMFDTMAPVIVPLTRAFIQMAVNALPGIVKGLQASVPIFLKIAEKAPQIGTAISKFFTIIAKYSPQAVSLLGGLLDALAWLIPAIATVIGWITRFYSTAIRVWSGIISWARRAGSMMASFVSGGVRAAIGAFNSFRAGATSRINAVLGVIRSIPGRIRSALGGLGGLLVGAGRALIQGLINGIQAMLGRVRSAISSVKNAVAGARNLLPFSAGSSFQMAFASGPSFAAGNGGARTEAPREITLDNRVYLGNELLDTRTRRIVRDEMNTQAYRARVGRR